MSTVTEPERVLLERLRSADRAQILIDPEVQLAASLSRKGLIVRGFIGRPVRVGHYVLTLFGEQVAMGRVL